MSALKIWMGTAFQQLGLPRSVWGKMLGMSPRQIYIAQERAKMSKKLWWTVIKRDGFQCRTCGRRSPEVKLHVDHIVPLARSGKTEIGNLQTLCEWCNLGKGVDLMT